MDEPEETEIDEPPKKKIRWSPSEDDCTDPLEADDLLKARARFFEMLSDCKSRLGGAQAGEFRDLFRAAKTWEAEEDLLLS